MVCSQTFGRCLLEFFLDFRHRIVGVRSAPLDSMEKKNWLEWTFKAAGTGPRWHLSRPRPLFNVLCIGKNLSHLCVGQDQSRTFFLDILIPFMSGPRLKARLGVVGFIIPTNDRIQTHCGRCGNNLWQALQCVTKSSSLISVVL